MSEDPKAEPTLVEAAEAYAVARSKLPEPGQEFHGPNDAQHFAAFCEALLELERAALRAAQGQWMKAAS